VRDSGHDRQASSEDCDLPHVVVLPRPEYWETVVTPKPPVPVWRWASWFTLLGLALIVFYVLLTPLWLGLRALAWLADRKARIA
jgi:hypothetical protein